MAVESPRKSALAKPMPRAPGFDNTLSLLRDPYRYISRTCRDCRSDLFATRLLLRPVTCMTGGEAARVFYDPARFERAGALPAWISHVLFGRGGVQSLDGAAHLHRKQMLLSLTTPDRVAELAQICERKWREASRRWQSSRQVVLYDAAKEVLCRSVCQWAGVPLREADVERVTRDLTALFDRTASIGPRHIRARLARRRSNRWIERIIEDVRSNRLQPSSESAVAVVARHRDLQGHLLPARVAAVELLNVLRPTVAVSVFITFAAVALHEYPECRQRWQSPQPDEAEFFAQEVRRFFPFFPAVAARVRKEFTWREYRFPQGHKVLLDLYGTNHDPRVWNQPEAFRPERFRRWDESPFNFIPQGGGDQQENHRCPGEGICLAMIDVAGRFLTSQISYAVPEQNLRIDYSRLPALPWSRFIIENVKAAS